MTKTNTLIPVTTAFLSVLAFLVVMNFAVTPYQHKTSNTNLVACTQEAKLCPDGSYVGRTGPKCEFATCPGTNTNSVANINTVANTNSSTDATTGWKTYTNSTIGYSIKYPSDWKVVDTNKNQVYINSNEKLASDSIAPGSPLYYVLIESIKDNSEAAKLTGKSNVVVGGITGSQGTLNGIPNVTATFLSQYGKTVKVSWNSAASIDTQTQILKSFLFTSPAVSSSTWWFSSTDTGSKNTNGELLYWDAAQKKLISARTFPSQGTGSDNIIIQPQAGKVAYFRFTGNAANANIVVSTTTGSTEKIVASGQSCYEGDCPNQMTIGGLSPDGTWLMYSKGTKQYVYSLADEKSTVIPIPAFSRTTFINDHQIAYIDSSATPIQVGMYDVNDATNFEVALSGIQSLSSISGSSDGKYIVASGQIEGAAQKTDTKIWLVDATSHKVLDTDVLDYPQTGVQNILWVSPTSFVANVDSSDPASDNTRTIFLYSIVNGTLSGKKIYADPKNVDSYEMALDQATGGLVINQSLQTLTPAYSFTKRLVTLSLSGKTTVLYSNPTKNPTFLFLNHGE